MKTSSPASSTTCGTAGAKRNAKPYSVAWPGISGQNELGNNARDKIVERACELYDGQRFVTEREEEDESQINVCECCGSRDIQVRAWVDGNTNEYISDIDDSDDDFWCDSCEEAHYFVSMK